MIKLNLLKIGKWGMAIFGCLFVFVLITIFFLIPEGELAIVWFVYAGIVSVVAKWGFIASIIVWVVGLMNNQKDEDDGE